MPLMKLHRDHTLRTTYGHCITFQKDKPTHVPPTCVQPAAAIGAVMASGDPADVIPPPPPPANGGPADPTKRRDEVVMAMNEVIKSGQRGQFSADGVPTARALSDLLGYPVEKKEIMKVWLERAEMIASGLLAEDGSKGTAV